MLIFKLITNTAFYELILIECLKGTLGNLRKASDSKLALKPRSPPSLRNHFANSRILQNTQTRSDRAETNL